MNDACCLREYLENGSEAAFRALVQRHLDLVYATAMRRLGNQILAEEAAQKVFILLARKAAFLAGRENLAGWLYKTALLKARELVREECRRSQREQQAVLLGTTMKTGESLFKSLSGVLDEAVHDLREQDRQALLLRFFEDKSLREVGQRPWRRRRRGAEARCPGARIVGAGLPEARLCRGRNRNGGGGFARRRPGGSARASSQRFARGAEPGGGVGHRFQLAGSQACDAYKSTNHRRLLHEWFKDLSSCPLRITVFTPVKSPEGGWTRLLVEYKVKDLDSDRLEACQIFYPEDETALGFRRFATLVRNYVGQSGR